MSRPNLGVYWQRLRRSAMLVGVAATGVRIGVNLLLVPLVLMRLSAQEQALWWVFVALGNFAGLADFGFGQAIARVYSYLWAGAEDFDAEGLRAPSQQSTPNFARIRQLHATVRYLYGRLSLVAVLLLAAGGTWSLVSSVRAMEHPGALWWTWAAYLLVIAYGLGTNCWMFACQGVNQVRKLQIGNLWSGLAYVVTAGLLLEAGYGLAAMVIATGVRGVIAREIGRRGFREVVPMVAGQEAKPDLSILARLWPNARKFGVLSIGAYLVTNGGVLVSSHFLGPETTASFGLSAQVGVFVMNFAGLWLTVKWPQITILRTQGRLEEMAILFARRLAFAMGTFFVLAAMMALTGNAALHWKGSHTRLLAAPCLVFYFFYLAQQLFYVEFGGLAHTENVVPFFRISLLTGIGELALWLVMTPCFGLWGLLLAPLIAESVYSSWFVVRRGFQGQPLTPRQFVRAALHGRL